MLVVSNPLTSQSGASNEKQLALFLLLAFLVPATASAVEPTDAHFVAGVVAFQNGDFDKATVELQASIDAQATSKAALYLGNAYLKLGKLDLARVALSLALKLDPTGPKRDGILELIQNIDARTGVKITVTSTPPGATVYIDSQATGPRGKTPLEVSAPLGQHQVIAVLDGYETGSHDQLIAAGNAIKIDFPLVAAGCELSLSAEPEGTQASVDGAPKVALPAKVRVSKGDHKVAFTGESSQPKELPARCDGGGPMALVTSLIASGRLKIPNATEPGAIVTVDGKVVKMSAADAAAGVGLPVGRHQVTVTAPNHAPWSATVDVGATGAVTPVAPPTPADSVPMTDTQSIYVGMEGAGNFALRNWNLGSNAFVAQDGTHGIHPGTSGMVGLRIGYRVIPRLAVEGELYWVGLPNQLNAASQGVAYDVNVVFNILKGSWTPIVEGGVGMYQVVSGPLGTDLALRGHLGGGLRGRLLDWLFLRVDVRDVASRGFEGIGANNIEAVGGLELVVWQKRPASSPVLIGRN